MPQHTVCIAGVQCKYDLAFCGFSMTYLSRRGQGRRVSIETGTWTRTPRDSHEVCSAEKRMMEGLYGRVERSTVSYQYVKKHVKSYLVEKQTDIV